MSANPSPSSHDNTYFLKSVNLARKPSSGREAYDGASPFQLNKTLEMSSSMEATSPHRRKNFVQNQSLVSSPPLPKASVPPKFKKENRGLSPIFLYSAYSAAIFAVVAVFVALAIFSFPPNRVNAAGIPPPAVNAAPILPVIFPAANAATEGDDIYDPPVIGQGGTCIEGSVIDQNHDLITTGLDITVTPKNGGVAVTKKSIAGTFQFPELVAGTYTMTVNVLPGWQALTPPQFDVVLNGMNNSPCAKVRFKFELPGCLVVSKLNHDKTGQTVGIPDWTFTLNNPSNAPIIKKTDSDGNAYFPNLLTGMWTVTETIPAGWWPIPVTQTTDGVNWQSAFPNPADAAIVVLPPIRSQTWWALPTINPYTNATTINVASSPWPQDLSICQPVPFVNKQIKGSIVVKKQDQNGNPLPNWNFTLTRVDGTQPPLAGVTGTNGEFCFEGLELGDWNLNEVPQTGWTQVSAPSNPINLTTYQDCSQVPRQVFVNKPAEPLGCIDGYKINDLEQVLPGWTIKATNLTTNAVQQQVTNSAGFFQFTGLAFGNWQVEEVMQTGWTAVTPSSFPVTVNSTECKHVRFKNRTQFACLDVWKKDAYDGVGLPDWVINLQPAFGGNPVAPQATNGQGWTRFIQLQPGFYDVWEEAKVGWNPIGANIYRQIKLEASGTCAIVTFCNLQDNMSLPGNQACTSGVSGTSSSPSVLTTVTSVTAPPTNVCTQSYTIRSGDTFYEIASKFNIMLNALEQANPTVNPRLIDVGTSICIP